MKLLFISTIFIPLCFAKYNCKVGCDSDPAPVCGKGEITYQNECFAFCQDVAVLRLGSCEGDAQSKNVWTDVKDMATAADMKRFASEGFKLVRLVDISTLQVPTTVQYPEKDHESFAKVQAKRTSCQAERFSADGRLYIGNVEKADPTGPPRSSCGSEPPTKINSRQLFVIGDDTRARITDANVSPYKMIGITDLGCTGTAIYKNAVLTAAHCVYDAVKSEWSSELNFYPGKNGASDPFGVFEWDYVTKYKDYNDTDKYDLDMAVIVYRKNEQGKSIGDVVGYVGLDEISGFDDPDLDASGITGYPADKPGGEMWTMGPMGTCPNGFWEDTDYDFVVRHDCDTTPGTSGAALLRIVPDLRARGVNVYGDAKNGYNGANVFMPGSCLYQSAMKWSGRCRTCKWWQILCRLTRPCVR